MTTTEIRYAALLDTETSGTDPEKDVTVEVAVMLFDVKRAQPVASFSSLIKGDRNEAHEINGIPPDMLPEAREADPVWSAARWVVSSAQVIIAHNAEFDRGFCNQQINVTTAGGVTSPLGRPWICSENDITWPHSKKGGRGGNLAQLALALGLGVASAHRAMADVDTLSRILTRLAEKGHDLEKILLHATRPKAMFHALTSYDEREVTKQNGFRWNPDTKTWWRRMFVEDAAQLPFKTRMVTG